MFRLFGPGLFGVALMVLWIYCILDVIATDESLVRNLPKLPWLFIVIFLPTVGSVAWLALGRPQFAGWRPGDTSPRQARPVRGPEDDPDWLRHPGGRGAPSGGPDGSTERARRLQAWEDELRRRESELRRREDEGPAG